MTIIAAADGSALGNPGPAGWGWYVDRDHWASGGWDHGTNNMGELMAVLDLLQQTAHVDEELHVFCDSTYVINTITKWMAGWKRRGWKKGDGKPVMNLDLVQALDTAMQGRRVRFEWVKGHAGHELNEEADRLANAAAVAHKEGRVPEAGPGWPGAATTGVPAAETEPDLFSEMAEDDGAPSDAEQVIALERSLLTDEVRSDRASVAALLHPQWQEVDSAGRLWAREERLAEIAPIAATHLDVVSMSEVGPDAQLLVWRALGEDGSTTVRSSLWRRSGGSWQQVFHQASTEG